MVLAVWLGIKYLNLSNVIIQFFLLLFLSSQETSSKELSTLAKGAFELLKWRLFWGPHLQEAVAVILSSANDSNWRTRSATLTYLRTFMYRYGELVSHIMYYYQNINEMLSFGMHIKKVFVVTFVKQAHFHSLKCGETTNLENC